MSIFHEISHKILIQRALFLTLSKFSAFVSSVFVVTIEHVLAGYVLVFNSRPEERINLFF